MITAKQDGVSVLEGLLREPETIGNHVLFSFMPLERTQTLLPRGVVF